MGGGERINALRIVAGNVEKFVNVLVKAFAIFSVKRFSCRIRIICSVNVWINRIICSLMQDLPKLKRMSDTSSTTFQSLCSLTIQNSRK